MSFNDVQTEVIVAHSEPLKYTDKILDVVVSCVDWLMPVVTLVLVLFILAVGVIGVKYMYRYLMQLRAQKEAKFSKRVSEINSKAQELAERWRICNNKEAELALRETNMASSSVPSDRSLQVGRPLPVAKNPAAK